jgi:hypothetical protein
MDLILEHATWVLAQSPEEGLRIFTEDLQEVEQLPRPRVLDFLLRVQPPLVIPYLVSILHSINFCLCLYVQYLLVNEDKIDRF